MSHHSGQPFDFNKMDIEKMFENNTPDLVKHLSQQQSVSLSESLKPKHDEVSGYSNDEPHMPEEPENKFPDGKLNQSDEGIFQYGMTVHDGRLVMNFFKPIEWVGFTKKEVEGLIEYMQSKLHNLK